MWYNGAGGDFLTHLLVVDDEVSILELIGADGGKNQGGVRGRSDGKQCRDKFHGIYADGFGKCSMFPLCGCFFTFSDGLFLAGSS